MFEGWTDVEHAPQGPGGALLDRLHSGNRPTSAPERGYLGCMEKHIPLFGYGLPPRSCTCRELTLPQEAEDISAESAKNPRRSRPPVCKNMRGQLQATSAGTVLPSVDLTGDLSTYATS